MNGRPLIVLDEHLTYLDGLRESGVTNMYGAGAHLNRVFPTLNRTTSNEILCYWMESFAERLDNEEVSV